MFDTFFKIEQNIWYFACILKNNLTEIAQQHIWMLASFGLLGKYHVLCTRAFCSDCFNYTNYKYYTHSHRYNQIPELITHRHCKTDSPLLDVSTLLSLVLDGIIFFFQCFQKEGQKNFMQLHNTDVFNRSYYSREAEIFFCTGFFTCFHSSCVNFSSIIY